MEITAASLASDREARERQASLAPARGSEAAELKCPHCGGTVIYKDLITGKQYQCDECLWESFNQERTPLLPNDPDQQPGVKQPESL